MVTDKTFLSVCHLKVIWLPTLDKNYLGKEIGSFIKGGFNNTFDIVNSRVYVPVHVYQLTTPILFTYKLI